MSLRRSTKSRLIPIQYYAFKPDYIEARRKARKAVVNFKVPDVNYGGINFQSQLYTNVLGLLPDQHRNILEFGIPRRALFLVR